MIIKYKKQKSSLKNKGLYLLILLLSISIWLSEVALSQNVEQSIDPPASTKTLVIFHTNDLHARMLPNEFNRGGFDRIAGYVAAQRKIRPDIIFLDAGDTFQGSPIASMTKGEAPLKLMNLMGYQAMTPGNHDLDFGLETTIKLFKQAKFAILAANMPAAAKPYPVKASKKFNVNGVMVGVIGLTYNPQSIGSFYRESTRLRKEVDVLIALTHQGLKKDMDLAQKVPFLDVIIGGHSHTKLEEPIFNQATSTIIAQTGCYGEYLGRLDLVVNTIEHKVLRQRGRLIPVTNALPSDPVVKNLISIYEDTYKDDLNRVVGFCPYSLHHEEIESPLGNWITDAIRKQTGKEIVLLNNSAIQDNLPRGDVTVRDVWQVLPFDDYLCTFTLNGRAIRMLLEHGLKTNEILQISGFKYSFVKNRPDGKKVIKHNLVPRKKYTVVTTSYVCQRSEKFFGREIDYEVTDLLLRDVVLRYLEHNPRIEASIEGRILELR